MYGKGYESGCYVKPCIAEVENHFNIVQHETFAPILYLIKYKTMEEAIALFDKSIELNQSEFVVWFNRGMAKSILNNSSFLR